MSELVPLCSVNLMLGRAVEAGNAPAGQRMAAVRLAIRTGVQAAGKGIMSADLSRIDYEVYELQ